MKIKLVHIIVIAALLRIKNEKRGKFVFFAKKYCKNIKNMLY
jgi:hypothetical protein